jgi:hypoxanthine-guanine phosphoribosyltransferase
MFRDTVELRETLIEQVEIQRRVGELGREITRDYQGKAPLLVGVLTGASVFHADPIRYLELKLRMDFIAMASYGTDPTASFLLAFNNLQSKLSQMVAS